MDTKLQTGLVTLLFTDIVGSTALKQQLGDRAAARVIEQHHCTLRDLLNASVGGRSENACG